MKKISKIMLPVIIIEAVLTIIYYFRINPCGSACDMHSFLYPFGKYFDQSIMCTANCVPKHYPFFYQIADLLILTVVVYLVILIIKKYKKI